MVHDMLTSKHSLMNCVYVTGNANELCIRHRRCIQIKSTVEEFIFDLHKKVDVENFTYSTRRSFKTSLQEQHINEVLQIR